MAEQRKGIPQEVNHNPTPEKVCTSDQMIVDIGSKLKVGEVIYIFLPAHSNVDRLQAVTLALTQLSVQVEFYGRQKRSRTEYYKFKLTKLSSN